MLYEELEGKLYEIETVVLKSITKDMSKEMEEDMKYIIKNIYDIYDMIPIIKRKLKRRE